MKIGFFGVEEPRRPGPDSGQHDRAYLPKLAELIGPHSVKLSISDGSGESYFHSFAVKARVTELDCAIVTDKSLLKPLLETQPDFKIGYNKNGSEKKLSLNDYHGSLIEIPAHKLGRDKPIEVLFLNPLQHLRTVPEAPYVYKRYISKLTRPSEWFPQTEFTWEVVSESNVDSLYTLFQSALLIAADTETDEGSPHRTINCSGYCALFADGTTHSVVIPTIEMWGVLWMRRFNALQSAKIFQNGLYDNAYYARYNSPVTNWLYDTKILFHCWFSELPKRLDYITAFTIRKIRFWKDDGKTGGLHAHYEYNARDCWATLNSFLSMIREVPPYAIQNYLLEFPLVFSCLHSELDGLAVDKQAFDGSLVAVEAKLKLHEDKLSAWIGPGFNPGSPPQVKRLLFCFGYRDRSGTVDSSDDKTLTAAGAMSPFNMMITDEVQKVREFRKLRDTYLVWDKFWDDRLHYRIDPSGTDTGRLASGESSFWCGMPISTMPRGPEIKCFLRSDSDEWLLGENDFAQSEARCTGYISGCQTLIDLVEGPHDYHSWNAQAFFGIPYEQIYDEAKGKTIMKDIRDLSKRTNHGANYNMGAQVMLETMGPKKVAEARAVLGLPPGLPLVKVCAHLLDCYAKTYPEVKGDYQDWVKRTIKFTKKTVSALGWTRYYFSDPGESKMALNSAVAHNPQNLNAGILNIAYHRIWKEMMYGKLRGVFRLKAQIHDSVLYTYLATAPWVPEYVKELMTIPVPVTDIKGKTRTLVIPPDISAGKTHWSMLK